MRCARCRYDLRACDRESACPECGLAVRDSLVPIAVMAVEDPEARRAARIGIELIVAAMVTVIGTGPLAGILASATSARGSLLDPSLHSGFASYSALAAVILLGTLAFALGILLIRRVSVRTGVRAVSLGAGRLARGALVVVAAAMVLIAIAIIEAVRRGDGLLGPVASGLWLLVVPIRSMLLAFAVDAIRVLGLPSYRYRCPPWLVAAIAGPMAGVWTAIVVTAVIAATGIAPRQRPPSGVLVGGAVLLCAIEIILALVGLNAAIVAQRRASDSVPHDSSKP
jgi:hypothetical protein